MRRFRLSLAALLALTVFAVGLSGCGCFRKGHIKVNGEKIMKEQYYGALERMTGPRFARMGGTGAVPIGQVVVRKMIQDALILQYAKEQGVAPTDEQINRQIQVSKRMAGVDFDNNLREQGTNAVDYPNDLKVAQAQVNLVGKGMTVPESEVKAAYEQIIAAKPSMYRRPAQVRFSVIVSTSKDRIDKAYQLLKSETDFATVALKLSEDSTRQSGGDAGWTSAEDTRTPAQIRDMVLSLGINEFSKPFRVPIPKSTKSVWIIVKTDRKRPEFTIPYHDVKDIIRDQLKFRKGLAKNDRKVALGLQKFIQNSDIVVNSSMYEKLPKLMKQQAGEMIKQIQKTPAPPGTPAVPPAKP